MPSARSVAFYVLPGKHGVGVGGGGQVEHALERGRFLGNPVGQFCQRLGRGDPYGDRDARPLPNPCPKFPAIGLPLPRLQPQEGFVNRIDLHAGCQGPQGSHDAGGHVAVEGVVTAEHLNAVTAEGFLILERRGSHFYSQQFGLLTAGNHAAIVVAQHHHRPADEPGVEYPLAGAVKVIGINEGKPVHRAGWMTKVTTPQTVSS